jgi:hypothetical protein
MKKLLIERYHFLKKDKAKIFSILALLLVLIYGISLRLLALDSVIINEWITRDFDRAFSLLNGDYIPLAGPDLTNGGRLPGPFMYFFLLIPLWLHPAYESLFNFNCLLNIASLFTAFYISKKYFGFYFASISTALISIDLYHAGAVHFPTNPSFLIFFLILFAGIFFEFSIKRNEKIVPLLVLIWSLGIQFHYQMSIYILLPVLMAVIFKIRISKKSYLLSLIIVIICFLPYGIYKLKFHSPPPGFPVYDLNLYDSFIKKTVKSIPVQNTIENLFSKQPFDMHWYVSEELKDFQRISFSFVVYFLIFFLGFKCHKNGKEKYVKEISLISLFYIPAFIYELIGPHTLVNFWYNYVFILPKTYIIAYFLILSFKSINNKALKIGGLFVFLVLFLYLALYTSRISSVALRHFNKSLTPRNNSNSNSTGSYNNSKLLLIRFMKQLNLNPKEYYDRVYFLDFYPASLKRIQLAGQEFIKSNSRKEKIVTGPCFFIVDRRVINKSYVMNNSSVEKFDSIIVLKSKYYEAFLNDSSIDIQDVREISFANFGFAKTFFLYQYVPKHKQSCYRNSHNPFVVSKNIRNLIQQAKGLKVSNKNLKTTHKKISLNEKYTSKSELLFWEGKYVILNSINNSPFRLTVTIRKVNDSYLIRGTIDSFYYYFTGNTNFKFLDILVASTNNDVSSISSINSTEEKFKATIFAKNTFLTSNGLNHAEQKLRNYNQNWYRESLWEPKRKLTKDNFNIDVSWAIYNNGITQDYNLKLKRISNSILE